LGGGLNLASGNSDYPAGSTRLDFDVLKAQVSAGAQISSNKDETKVEAKVKVAISAAIVAGEVKAVKICPKDNCYTASFTPLGAIGGGLDLDLGYRNNKKTNNTSYTLAIAGGKSRMLGGKLLLEKEPNLEENKQHSPRMSPS
jgi:carbon monoxide dehydrogenase subunit G